MTRLMLNVVLFNPNLQANQVAVSVEKGSVPGLTKTFNVVNDLDLQIHNPTSAPLIWTNPSGLKRDFALPPIDEPDLENAPENALDRLYIYFPYGRGNGTLTTRELAAEITVSPTGENESRWETSNVRYSPEFGPYWTLFPRDEHVLEPNESVRFVLRSVKTFNRSGSPTHMNLKKNVKGYEVETDRNIHLMLVDGDPSITNLEVSRLLVLAGEKVTLSWSTWNASACRLGNKAVEPAEEKYEIGPLLKSTTYNLEATRPRTDGDGSSRVHEVSESVTVDVIPVTIERFGARPELSNAGQEVTLRWETISAVTVQIEPDVGKVYENAAGPAKGERVVRPTRTTTYTLTAYGENGPKVETATVFVPPPNWLVLNQDPGWRYADSPILLNTNLFNADASYPSLLFFGVSWHGQTQIYTTGNGVEWDGVRGQRGYRRLIGARAVMLQRLPDYDGKDVYLLGGSWVDFDEDEMKEVGERDFFNNILMFVDPPTGESAWQEWYAQWSPRSDFGCVKFNNNVFVFGGRGREEPKGERVVAYNDVWSSDASYTWGTKFKYATWKKLASAPWDARFGFAATVFDQRLWMFGGITLRQGSEEALSDIWTTSNGVNWQKEQSPPWRDFVYICAHCPQYPRESGFVYVVGTKRAGTTEVWQMRLDGSKIVWKQEPSLAPPYGFFNAGSTIIKHRDGHKFRYRILFAGGTTLSGPNEIVWAYLLPQE